MLSSLRTGRRHERRAARLLKRHGLKIIALNVRAGRDEIDLIARDGDTAVVVEVRYRHGGLWSADASVTQAKGERVLRGWQRLSRDLKLPRQTRVRFDLVLLDDHRATWLRDALGREAT